MSTPVVIALIAGGVALLSVCVYYLTRKGGGPAVARYCGGCRRAMLPQWDRCMFCGWTPVPRLEFLCGPLAGQVLELREEVTTIGSVAGNTIILADPAVSKKHLGIRRMPSGYEFADFGSTNGVYLNGHKIPKKTLVPGDILRVGNTEMVFRQG